MTVEREVTHARTDTRYLASGVLSTGKKMWWASPWVSVGNLSQERRKEFLQSIATQLETLRVRYGVSCRPLQVQVETRRTSEVIERTYRTRFDSEVTPRQ